MLSQVNAADFLLRCDPEPQRLINGQPDDRCHHRGQGDGGRH